MNRLVIPTIVVLAVIALGTIMLSPVDKVSAVHTTLLANIEDQQRTLFFTMDNGSTAANIDIVVITLDAGDDFNSEGFISSAGAGDCDLEDPLDLDLINSVADEVVEGVADVGVGALADGEDIEIDISANTTCSLYLHIIAWE